MNVGAVICAHCGAHRIFKDDTVSGCLGGCGPMLALGGFFTMCGAGSATTESVLLMNVLPVVAGFAFILIAMIRRSKGKGQVVYVLPR